MGQGLMLFYMTKLVLSVNSCTKYENDPSSSSNVIEHTQVRQQTDGCMDRQLDKVKPIYPLNYTGGGYEYIFIKLHFEFMKIIRLLSVQVLNLLRTDCIHVKQKKQHISEQQKQANAVFLDLSIWGGTKFVIDNRSAQDTPAFTFMDYCSKPLIPATAPRLTCGHCL